LTINERFFLPAIPTGDAMSPQALKARKGEETRAQILEAAVQQASEAGFESLTIGTLAERTGLSKSGLFAHFGSRTDLQIAALDESSRRFTEAVFLPALKVPRGLKRLRVLFGNWIVWPERAKLRGSCPMQAASAIRRPARPDAVSARPSATCRSSRPCTGFDSASARRLRRGQLFRMFGLVLACFHSNASARGARARALAGFERLVDANRATAAKPASRPAAARR